MSKKTVWPFDPQWIRVESVEEGQSSGTVYFERNAAYTTEPMTKASQVTNTRVNPFVSAYRAVQSTVLVLFGGDGRRSAHFKHDWNDCPQKIAT